MTENKKIKNATINVFNKIKFKSQLEKMIYNHLYQLGLNPKYEPTTYILIDAFEAKTPFYDKETDSQYKKRKELGDNRSRMLVKKRAKIQSIKYTPDFYFKYNNLHVYIEAKGIENDVFYIKKKLFIRLLDTLPQESIYFEIYTKKQLLQAIEIIKDYGKSCENN